MFTNLWYNEAKKGGDYMWQFVSNAFTFILIYLLTTLIAKFIRFFILIPRCFILNIKSRGIYDFLVFPNNIFSRNRNNKKKKKDRHLMLSELIFCILNQVILVGAIVLQFLPSMPCDTIEVTFDWRHRGLDSLVCNHSDTSRSDAYASERRKRTL